MELADISWLFCIRAPQSVILRAEWMFGLYASGFAGPPPSRVAQRTGAKALFKLFLIYPNRPSDADYTIGGYLALPYPEVGLARRALRAFSVDVSPIRF